MRLDQIKVGPGRLRQLRMDVVASLMESMRARGQLQPIVVTEKGMLIAGMHRLEAARRLGWDEIEIRVMSKLSTDDRLLAEIDENLIRAELGPAEIALHHAERKRIYLKQHPETAHGAAGKHRPKALISENRKPAPSYADAAAAQVNQTRSTVGLALTRAANIPMLEGVIGTSLDQGDELDALAKLSPGLQEDLIKLAAKGAKVSAKPMAKQLRRAEREQDEGLALTAENAAQALAERKFGVIYMDPPWRMETYSDAGKDRNPENHYPTLDMPDIKALCPPMADDCAMFMWTTVPMLALSLILIEGWGLTYKSMMIWHKPTAGTGYWTRNNAEILLIATRGTVVAPAPGLQPLTLIQAPTEGHSRKPGVFARVIEEWYPHTPKLEMYARPPFRPGWTVWGNEVEGGMMEIPKGEISDVA
jgi:N6-adenosine-specific RNA methylase IME4